MIRSITTTLLLISLSACTSSPATPTVSNVTATPPATQSPQATLPNDWAGAITHADGTIESIMVQLTANDGTLNLQPQSTPLTISNVQRDGNSLSFKAEGKSTLEFSGKFDGRQVTGEVKQSGQTNSFVLLPLVSSADIALADYLGTYQFESGEALLINQSPEYSSSGLYFFGPTLTLMVNDFRTGALRGLFPIGLDTFWVGSTRAIGYPFDAQITFMRDNQGKINSLNWQTFDQVSNKLSDASAATRLAASNEIVHFTSSDGVTLTGLLTLPPTPGPHPAIMMLHGSEPGTRDDFGDQLMSSFMASQDVIILTYDKRGVGDSGGHYVEAASDSNLKLHAQDAIAGVNYLKGRSEVDAQHIGLIGGSQAGWIIPIAASQSSDISYFIITSGPVTSVGHEDVFSSYTNDGDTPTNYSQGSISKTLANRPPSGFDPVPVIEKLDQAGLWLWGDQDKSQPTFESAINLQKIVDQGKTNFTYVVFPNADHNLQQSIHGLFNEIPFSVGYPENFYSTLADWLQHNVKR